MKCYECKWLDRSVILTSYPPQYRCTLGFGSHYADHECEYDFMPIVRCKDCKYKYVSGNGTTQFYVCDFMDAQYEENGFCHHAEREINVQ